MNACILTFAAVQIDVAMNQCIIILNLIVLGFKLRLLQRTSIGPSGLRVLTNYYGKVSIINGSRSEIALLSWDHSSMVNKTCGNDKQHAIQ